MRRAMLLAVFFCGTANAGENEYVSERCSEYSVNLAALQQTPHTKRVEQKIAEQQALLDSCTHESRVEWRKQEQRQRQAEAEETRRQVEQAQTESKGKHQAEEETLKLAAMREDPDTLRVAMSATICEYQQLRREDLTLIAEERRYAKIGGVIDMQRIHDLQDNIRSYDSVIDMFNRGLKARRLKAMSCKISDVASAASCIRRSGAECEPYERMIYLLVKDEIPQ